MRTITLLFFLLHVCVVGGSAQVSATVLDELGQPVTGATLALYGAEGSNPIVGITDLAGKVEVIQRVGGLHSVEIRYVGYDPIIKELELVNGQKLMLGELSLKPDVKVLAEAQVVAVRAKPSDPFAFTNVDGEELSEANTGQDLPVLLRRTPGAVFTSDAGNGVGYTGIRIRGADATRINVTINGVPLNDSESQGVFWVNMPDFVSSTSSIQVQRGVGESTYGTGAFGANINLVTAAPATSPRFIGELAGGSFGTGRAMVKASTGQLQNGLSVEGRLSYIQSNGFIDRASTELGSAYLASSWAIDQTQQIQLIGFTGNERTYQAWGGVPRGFLDDDSDLLTFNPEGDRGDGTFYDDQTDNYRQSHVQLLYSKQMANDMLLQFTGHYTKGLGYFEQWRNDEDLSDYFEYPENIEVSTDLVRRLWLDNDFYGGIATLSGKLSPKLALTASAGINEYRGDHFGTVPFLENTVASLGQPGEMRFYENDAVKRDANGFVKVNYNLSDNFSTYLDAQVRNINYSLEGVDRNVGPIKEDHNLTFFNPKVGFSLSNVGAGSVFFSAAVGQREPNRSDFVDNLSDGLPKSERLYDIELGYRVPSAKGRRYTLEVNAYSMIYRDQLINTGEVNDVGEAVRTNVDRSYRLGLELAGAVALDKTVSIEGNVSLSRSRFERFEETIVDFGTGDTRTVVREDAPISFSPDFIGNLGLIFTPTLSNGKLELALWANRVSKQFLDNSGEDVAALDGFTRFDVESKLEISKSAKQRTLLTLQVQNILGTHAPTNGYAYRYDDSAFDATTYDPYVVDTGDNRYVGVGIYPQAGVQVLVGVRVELTGAKR